MFPWPVLFIVFALAVKEFVPRGLSLEAEAIDGNLFIRGAASNVIIIQQNAERERVRPSRSWSSPR